MSTFPTETVLRPKMFCPYCGTKGVKEITKASVLSKIPRVQFLQCDACGNVFWRDAFVALWFAEVGK